MFGPPGGPEPPVHRGILAFCEGFRYKRLDPNSWLAQAGRKQLSNGNLYSESDGSVSSHRGVSTIFRGPSAQTVRADRPRGPSARTVHADRPRGLSARTVRANRPLGPSTRTCLLYTSPSPRDQRGTRMPSSA